MPLPDNESQLLKLEQWPIDERSGLVGVLTDIDDTLTTEGAITPDALAALRALKEAGLFVIAITGRPMGWSHEIAAHWPLDAVVAENGGGALVRPAGALWQPGAGPLLERWYVQDDAERAANYARLQGAAQRVLAAFPEARLATDSPGRETDIAVDHSEFAQLPPSTVEAIVQQLRTEGLNATVSSIHINAWIGTHDKLSGARWIVQRLLGREVDAELTRWAYIGDSANDEKMFAHFQHGVGVANILPIVDRLRAKPHYVTPSARGKGFAEFAAAVLGARDAAA